MVGKALKAQREIQGISQRELAKATGIKQANISRWESNIQSPAIDYCIQLADFYKVSLDELVGRDF